MHLLESGVLHVFHKLQSALLVVKPHGDKMAAKVMINTRWGDWSLAIIADNLSGTVRPSFCLETGFYKVWYWRWVGLFVVTGSLFGFTKLILHHPCAVTAASLGSTIADFALTTTCQLEPCIPWSRLTHILPCHTPMPFVWALVCATAPPVPSPAKTSAILNESVTAVTASRFSPVITVYTYQHSLVSTLGCHIPKMYY